MITSRLKRDPNEHDVIHEAAPCSKKDYDRGEPNSRPFGAYSASAHSLSRGVVGREFERRSSQILPIHSIIHSKATIRSDRDTREWEDNDALQKATPR
jgi:hypothetical protein